MESEEISDELPDDTSQSCCQTQPNLQISCHHERESREVEMGDSSGGREAR